MKLRPKSLTTYYVRTDYVYMNITLSIDRSVISEARRRAKTLGTSVNQLVREFLEQFAGKTLIPGTTSRSSCGCPANRTATRTG
jgi:antitoxin component of RelBE/YafQ-DinJ toxin-antitoxin module